ncbi:MAG: alpha-L-fucosidase [Burkholderiales bacterium]|nr:alpha-L-fucosidase [Opitutaceae bacterium]
MHTASRPDLSWFRSARFGVSFHWGVASVPGRGDGWLRSGERMPLAAYDAFFAGFRPARDWAARWADLAKNSGAGYAVLTAKHHDGFCLWPTALTDYNIDRTPAKDRDLVGEFVAATRAAGLRVGLYYSLVDWRHPDYPHFGDRQHPHRFDPAARDAEPARNFSRYVDFLHGQIRELLTNYGRIDLLVVDFSYWHLAGETWRAAELVAMIRALQPGILINDRLQGDAIKQAVPPPWTGDFDTAELDIPREPVRSDSGRSLLFDSWFPVGKNWFHDEADAAAPERRKTTRTLLRALVNCVSKDGNLLLNLAPDATGALHPHDVDTLRALGAWLDRNGESLLDAGPAPDHPKPEWGRWTSRGDTLYAHILEPFIGHLSLPGLRGRVKTARVLATGRPALIGNYWNAGVQRFDAPDDLFLNFEAPLGDTHPLPDEIDTVVALELATTDAERAALLAPLDAARHRACAERHPVP